MILTNLQHQNHRMKATIAVFAISLLAFQHTYSQNRVSPNENTLSFSVGASIPVGNFSSTNSAGKLAGYARTGETINFSFEHKLNKKTGLVAMLYGQRNGINTDVRGRQFDKTGWFGSNSFEPRYYPNWSIAKKSWHLESLLFGVSGEFPVDENQKFSFTAKMLLGLAYAQLPKLNASSKTDTSFTEINQSGASAFGFSYLASVGIKYKWSQKIYLLGSIDYFGTSQISFENVTGILASTNGGLVLPHVHLLSNSRMPPMYHETTATNRQPFNAVSVNFGVGVKL